jgi:predicted outer membrane repeat protein
LCGHSIVCFIISRFFLSICSLLSDLFLLLFVSAPHGGGALSVEIYSMASLLGPLTFDNNQAGSFAPILPPVLSSMNNLPQVMRVIGFTTVMDSAALTTGLLHKLQQANSNNGGGSYPTLDVSQSIVKLSTGDGRPMANGGAIYADISKSLTVESNQGPVMFTGNSADQGGGLFLVKTATVTM